MSDSFFRRGHVRPRGDSPRERVGAGTRRRADRDASSEAVTHIDLGHLGMDVQRDSSALLLRLRGEFDLTAERRFHDSLENLSWARVNRLVVDLSQLAFIDSAGLRAMLELLSRSRRDGFEFQVVVPPGRVRTVFETTGLDRVLSLSDAPAALDPSSS
jgi:anti-sigma B factor antagonist